MVGSIFIRNFVHVKHTPGRHFGVLLYDNRALLLLIKLNYVNSFPNCRQLKYIFIIFVKIWYEQLLKSTRVEYGINEK